MSAPAPTSAVAGATDSTTGQALGTPFAAPSSHNSSKRRRVDELTTPSSGPGSGAGRGSLLSTVSHQRDALLRGQLDEALGEVLRLTDYSRGLESELSFVQGQLKCLYRDSTLLLEAAGEAQRLRVENAALKEQLQELRLQAVQTTNTLATVDQKAAALAESAAAQRDAAMAFFARFASPVEAAHGGADVTLSASSVATATARDASAVVPADSMMVSEAAVTAPEGAAGVATGL